MKAKRSLRALINAKCKDCIYDPLSGMGTWRQQVEACECEECPLWAVRPKAAKGTPESASLQAIIAMEAA